MAAATCIVEQIAGQLVVLAFTWAVDFLPAVLAVLSCGPSCDAVGSTAEGRKIEVSVVEIVTLLAWYWALAPGIV